MNSLYYTGEGVPRKAGAEDLPAPRRAEWGAPEKYLPDPGLVDAANVAVMLGQPLLLTGAPGTGKTQFASSLGWELGLGKPFKFETKSTSAARDLFYTYDAIKRFQDVQSRLRPKSILPYLKYQALGIAILRTRDKSKNEGLVDESFPMPEKPTRSVVLIDEIDKAPRDFPNDILNEIENMFFHIPEMGVYNVNADPNLLPIVVITSNSEKDLPDAFLRRCIYYNIPAPDKDRLKQIVGNRIGDHLRGTNAFLDDALELFISIRESGNLRKPVSTAELLGWLMTLQANAPKAGNPLAELAKEAGQDENLDTSRLVRVTLNNLIKNSDDDEIAKEAIRKWQAKQANQAPSR